MEAAQRSSTGANNLPVWAGFLFIIVTLLILEALLILLDLFVFIKLLVGISGA